MTNFVRYPITLYIGNYNRKIIPYSIFYASKCLGAFNSCWILHGLCNETKHIKNIEIDNISDWKLRHSIAPEGGGVRIDHQYRLLIKKENESNPYLTHIYHLNDLKFHLNETLKKSDEIIFTQNVSLKIPPHDYFL